MTDTIKNVEDLRALPLNTVVRHPEGHLLVLSERHGEKGLVLHNRFRTLRRLEDKDFPMEVTPMEEDKIPSEITEISIRVVRNGVVKSGTRAIPAVESLHPAVVALEFETLTRDVAKAAGLPVPDQKPKGLEDFSHDLVSSMEGVAGILARLYEKYMSSGALVEEAYREVLADLGSLVVHAQSLNKSLMALETAMTLSEFLGEDGK